MIPKSYMYGDPHLYTSLGFAPPGSAPVAPPAVKPPTTPVAPPTPGVPATPNAGPNMSVPNYANLSASSSRNINELLNPTDFTNVQRQAAEHAVAGGFSGSGVADALGTKLTEEERIRRMMLGEEALTGATGRSNAISNAAFPWSQQALEQSRWQQQFSQGQQNAALARQQQAQQPWQQQGGYSPVFAGPNVGASVGGGGGGGGFRIPSNNASYILPGTAGRSAGGTGNDTMSMLMNIMNRGGGGETPAWQMKSGVGPEAGFNNNIYSGSPDQNYGQDENYQPVFTGNSGNEDAQFLKDSLGEDYQYLIGEDGF